MRNLTKKIFLGLFLATVSLGFSQTKVTGTVIDSETNAPLPGANVSVKGGSVGTVTDFDGKFSLEAKTSKGELVISYVGFLSKTVAFSGAGNVGNISLTPDASQLDEVVVIGSGVIDLAKDRKTPIAVSTIKAADIQSKIGTSDITQTMVNTPSVYVAGQAGGFGDSRITVRGFQQDNTAFLLNGQPINGMEDGKMYWSNWSGMSDIANAVQIQRGLGSSKLAISSVGGTVNFVTKSTDLREGGFVSTGIANDDYVKSTVAYNTGKMKNGLGVSVMLTHWQGDGYNDGTKGQGQNYFISFGYQPNENHKFNFLVTGAPQWHDQNYTKAISNYLKYGRKYNNNWGTQNGEYKSERTNFYHKPVANFNWDYKINSNMNLSTVVYASWGRGGGTGNYGTQRRTATGNIDFDAIAAANAAAAGEGKFGNGTYLIRASMNNHAWYGIVSNLGTKLNDNLSLNFGLDLRTYNGDHYRQVADYIGLKSWYETRKLFNQNHVNNLATTITATNTVTASLEAHPWTAFFNTVEDNQKIDYDYSETISYGGLFGQLEYSNGDLSAFLQAAFSNQSHQRFDYYDYETAYSDSEKVNNVGYNVKAGASYALENHKVYANAGMYSRQPYHDNIYLNYTNRLNPLAENEDILGLELGYAFSSKIFNASLNLYKTTWENRVTTTSNIVGGLLEFYSNQIAKQDHMGAELDFAVRPLSGLEINGFGSIGDWQYKGNTYRTTRSEDLVTKSETFVDVDGGKVGDAAQTTYGLGAKYKIFDGLSIDADWRNYDNLYANVVIKENLELPSYDLVDAGVSYKWTLGKEKKNSLNFRFNVNNVFNEVYLSELTSANKANPGDEVFKGIKTNNNGFFGFGRTWNFSMRFNF